jgi:hypothetical protein
VLLLAEEPAVASLAQGEVAGRAAPEALEESGEVLEGRRRGGARLGDGAPQAGLPDLGREEIADVPRPGASLA